MTDMRTLIREVPDFPAPGVSFKDISPLLASPQHFATAVAEMSAPFRHHGITLVAALDARGFLFGPSIAQSLGVGCIMLRKAGKLPGPTHASTYALEYGTATIELQSNTIKPADRVLLVDDVIATGGTLRAAATLIETSGATVAGYTALIGLRYLGDYRKKLSQDASEVIVSTVVEYT